MSLSESYKKTENFAFDFKSLNIIVPKSTNVSSFVIK